MALGLLGKKIGMTSIFDPQGNQIPVTVVEAGPCTVTQVKTSDRDGYQAVQVGFGDTKEKHLSKGERGHLVPSRKTLRHLREFRLADGDALEVGQELKADLFKEGQLIDVVGHSIGKGTMGMQRRFHAGRGPMAHGSKFHRHPGSIGAGTTPSRVYKGAAMPGKMGNERVTVKRLTVVRVDVEQNLLLIKGAVPGVEGGLLVIKPAVHVGRAAAAKARAAR